MMTKIDTSTEAVEALLKDVTPGPWEIGGANGRLLCHWDGIGFWQIASATETYFVGDSGKKYSSGGKQDANTKFIAASRQLVPAILAERNQLRDELDAAYAIIADQRGEINKLRQALSKKDQANDH